MTILSFFLVNAFILYLIFGLYVLNMLRKAGSGGRLYVIFFILCLVFAFWSLNHAFLVSAHSREECWTWYRVSLPCIAFFPVLIFHFISVLVSRVMRPMPRPVMFLLYLPGILFIARGLTGVFTVQDFVLKAYGWEIIHAVGSPWYAAFTAYYFLFLGLSLYLIVAWHSRTELIREKKQAALIFATAFIATVINITTHTVLPALDFYEVPQVAHIVTLIWIFGIWYSMVNYRLMSVPSQISIDDIISRIDEIVIILDPGMNIVSANGEFAGNIPAQPADFPGRPLADFLCMDDELQKEMGFLAMGGIGHLKCDACYQSANGPVWTDTTISRVADRFGDTAGFLVISKPRKGREYLESHYNITSREFDIIVLSVTGYSNARIGEKLGIAVRTVETHLTNIYNKLTIGSKVELVNIAHRYNILLEK